jgi:tRNA(Ile)-lysidine synthase
MLNWYVQKFWRDATVLENTVASDVRRAVERAITRAARQYALWTPGARLVVAVSGGGDSLCLLGALLALQKRGHRLAPGELIMAHLDHGLRGKESQADARYVERLASDLGLPRVIERIEVAPGAFSEEGARKMRYAFLRRVAVEHDAERIVTGHTRDDQAETILLHWLRGGGLAGLRGMAPLHDGIARPLLDVTHAQTLAYCAAVGWQPREDSSNRDPRFLRNRIRHELLPLLATYNPGIRDLLIRNGELLAEVDAYLEAQAQRAWADVADETTADAIRLRREPLRDLAPAIRHRLYRDAAREMVGPDSILEARHIAAIDKQLADGRTGTVLNLVGGVNTWLEYDMLVFQKKGKNSREPSWEYINKYRELRQHPSWRLSVPGVVEMPELGWRIRAWRIAGVPGSEDTGEQPPAPELPAFTHADRPAELGRAETRVYLDAAATGEHLTIRAWRPGDRFRPLGLDGAKKVQDYFTDAKAPRALRERIPLVFNANHLVWLAGLRIDDRVRITPTTQTVIALQLEPLEPATRPSPGESSR